MTRLVPCCNKILGTGPRMTDTEGVGLVPPARLPRCARNDNGARGEVIGLLLCLLFSHTSFFLPNPTKTSVAAENMPLIRHLGFAERERETFAKLIFHLSFLYILIDYSVYSTPAALPKSTVKSKCAITK